MNLRNNKTAEKHIPYFSFKNSFSEDIFNKTIKLKHRIIKKGNTFSVIDFECFNINLLDN